MYAMVVPFARMGKTWLTVGDGGVDAQTLLNEGAQHVIASSIDDAVLRRMQDKKAIDPKIEIRAENAEHLSLPDNSVDFVLVKECYHHLPRPALGLYEALRVARLGVLLIEPGDFGRSRPLDVLRALAKRILRNRPAVYDMFEPVGNFIYRISLPEVRKIVRGMGGGWFAWNWLNDFYDPRLADGTPGKGLKGALFALGLGVQNGLVRLRLMNPGLAVVFIPKASSSALRDVAAQALKIVDLPANPYSRELPSVTVGQQS
jgi:ubiquinone/menaquinone biosynthesis C-methylase UbiE